MHFNEYLKRIGYSTANRTAEDIAIVKAEYRRFYQRNYHKNYRKGFKRLEVDFVLKTFPTIEKIAKLYEVKSSTLIHNASWAYFNSEIYLPKFSDVKEILYLIRKNSNNINQLVKATHIQKTFDETRLNLIVEQVLKSESKVSELYTNPKVIYKPINLFKDAY